MSRACDVNLRYLEEDQFPSLLVCTLEYVDQIVHASHTRCKEHIHAIKKISLDEYITF
jgi:hypothetical protein